MVNTEDSILLVAEDIGLTEATFSAGADVTVHTDSVARGPSTVSEGSDVVMVEEGLAQGPGGVPEYINLKKLTITDRLLYVGDTTTLNLPVKNTDDQSHDFTVDWYENGGVFASETQTIRANSTVDYTKDVTKSSTGKFDYRGSLSNTVTATWLNVRPGSLTPSPSFLVDVGTTITWILPVENPGTTDVEVKIEFLNGADNVFSTTTETISAGNTVTFTADVTRNSATRESFQARVTETATGLSASMGDISVVWLEPGDVTNMDPNAPDATLDYERTGGGGGTGTIDPGNSISGGSESPGHKVGKRLDKVYWATWSTEGDAVEDCTIIYDWTMLDTDNYYRIEIYHGYSRTTHTWTVGNYDVGTHQTDNSDNFGQTPFEGRFYEDGTVTDTSGNTLGTWK